MNRYRRKARRVHRQIRLITFLICLTVLWLTWSLAAALTLKANPAPAPTPSIKQAGTMRVKPQQESLYIPTLKEPSETNYTNPNVPLTPIYQLFVQEISTQYGFDPNLIYAIMSVESNFDLDQVSATHDIGIMQINKAYYHAYYEYDPNLYVLYHANLQDRFDFKTNVITGINALRYWQEQEKKRGVRGRGLEEKILNHYNQGFKVQSTAYSKKVMKEVKRIAQ